MHGKIDFRKVFYLLDILILELLVDDFKLKLLLFQDFDRFLPGFYGFFMKRDHVFMGLNGAFVSSYGFLTVLYRFFVFFYEFFPGFYGLFVEGDRFFMGFYRAFMSFYGFVIILYRFLMGLNTFVLFFQALLEIDNHFLKPGNLLFPVIDCLLMLFKCFLLLLKEQLIVQLFSTDCLKMLLH